MADTKVRNEAHERLAEEACALADSSTDLEDAESVTRFVVFALGWRWREIEKDSDAVVALARQRRG